MKTPKYNYILVGSGVAGTTIAKRLLEHDPNTSILMLEAGPVVEAKTRRGWWDYVTLPKDRTPYDYTYDLPGEAKTIGNIDFITAGARVKAYGGSTMHWGAWALRFKPEDFHLHSNTDEGSDWPITYDDLEEYYCQAEEYMSVCGDDAENWSRRSKPYPMPPFKWTAADGMMIKAFREVGIKPGKMPMARYRKCMTTGTCKYCPFGARFSAQYVLDDLREDPRHQNFIVRTNSPVTKIVCSSRDQIEAIEYVDNQTGETIREHADTYIICSGTYETPKLLMNSTNRFWENGVGNDHDLLGRFIISHSMLKVRGRSPTNKEKWFQEYDFPTLMSRTYDTEEQQKKGKIFIFKNRALPNIDIASLMIGGNTPAKIEERVSGEIELELQAFMEEKGKFENRLQIVPGKDRFGLPLTTVDFNRTDEEMKNTKDRLSIMQKVIEAMGLEVVFAKPEAPGAHHATGTCKMGITPEEGVTDANLKVHDIKNLYLCSNGVFPTGSAVNPTLTLTALSMRLTDHLISQSKGN